MQKFYNLVLILILFPIAGMSQQQIVDEVVCVVGEKIISRSELDFEISQAEAQYGTLVKSDKCEMMENLMVKKLMLNQAEKDSVEVTDDEVEAEIDKRMRYFTSQAGGVDNFEKYLGKSIVEYKNEIRSKIRDQKLVSTLENQLFGDVKVSHREVKKYFDSIPTDSLPKIDAEYEVGQLVIKPTYSKVAKYYAFRTAQRLRERVLNGESFEMLARVYSGDPGSGREGGVLPEFGRGDMVPEFELAAYSLKKDSVSQVFWTEFGYHFIKLDKRLGDKITARHILIKPILTIQEEANLLQKMDSIHTLLVNKQITFCKAVSTYGNDDSYNANCGMLSDPYSGLMKLSISSMEPQTAQQISTMKPGEYAKPAAFYKQDGSVGVRIIYLKSETPAHIANMKQDYPRIQLAAQEAKKNDEIAAWVKKTRQTTYTNVNSDYLGCKLTEWTDINN